MKRRDWTRRELVVAFNLYCKIPFGKIDKSNSQIIALATALGRSPSALSWKLANFARLDPALKKRDVSGASHGNKLEQVVWDEFSHDWDALAFESERLMAELLNVSVEESIPDTFPEGITRDSLVRVRVNQGFFRSAVLTSYGCKCCITGIAIPELLCASHIVPWSLDPSNRTNPRNGLCLPAGFGPDCPAPLKRWLRDDRLKALANNKTRGHMPSDLARYLFAAIYAGSAGVSPKAKDFPEALAPEHSSWRSGKFADRFRVQVYDQPATTVTSHISKDGHYFIHPDPTQCRSLTVREAARLQTFPDNYFFKGNRTEQFIQVGNAVPPLLAKHIGQSLLSLLLP